MDILRKMFQQENEPTKRDNEAKGGDEFKKSDWFDGPETDFDDDRKFAFEIFTSPLELQKHFERQMQQILDAVSQFEDGDTKIDKNLKDEFLKPGFERSISKAFEKTRAADTDLDGEIVADELHSLLEKFKNTDNGHAMLPRNDNRNLGKYFGIKKKLTDEEKIFGKIHGTLADEESTKRPRMRADVLPPIAPLIPRNNGVFDDNYKGPKLFRQSIITKTIRKPDGSSETTQIRQDSDGNKTTTITRTKDGKSETVTTYDNHTAKDDHESTVQNAANDTYSDRNIYVSKQGYALPRNIW